MVEWPHGTAWEGDDRQGDGEMRFGVFPFTGNAKTNLKLSPEIR
jgi:hypothetical protein